LSVVSNQYSVMIYVLYGSDAFSRSEALRALKAELGVGNVADSNVTTFDAREATPQEVLAACDTVPFLGERRLVILEGALKKARGGGRRPRSRNAEPEAEDGMGPWGVLIEYAGRMPEQTALVLVDGESVDNVLLGALKPLSKVTSFAPPKGKDVAGWVQARARAMGLSIDGRACALIADRVGGDTWMIASELTKLASYKGDGTIQEADVRALVADVRNQEGYLLADAVADGKAAVATRLLHNMLAKDAVPAVLMLTIENRYRRIAVAREMVDAGATGSSIGSRLGMSGYGLERLLDQVSRYPMERVRRALDRIAQADFDVKQGLYDYDIGLELLVHELSAPDAERRPAQRLSATPAGSPW
jgi:DNA polymerase-3 subunit delta